MNNAVNLRIEQTTDDPLAGLNHEQLTRCARLLALSIAHHRAKFGVIPIASSNAEMALVSANDSGFSLKCEAGKTLNEALQALLEEGSTQASPEEPGNASNGAAPSSEQRRQLRVSVSVPISLCKLESGQIFTGTLRNISWGGAAVRGDGASIGIGTRVTLLLPAAGKRIIKIEATVLRDSMISDEHDYGLRFDSLDPDDEERLLEILNILLATPNDVDRRRADVRLVQRLEIEYGDAGEFHATLEDISAGCMMLPVPEPLEIDDSLLISLSSVDTALGLNLRARVVHQNLIKDTGIDMYRVGLQFERPSTRLRERISVMLHDLATMRPQYTHTNSADVLEISNVAKD